MFVNKPELIAMHENEFEAWERLLGSLSSAQITSPISPEGLSIKDTVAHLWAWQQRTIARLEAALHGDVPHFPQWAVEIDEEESPQAVDRANAWILETQRDRPWEDIYQGWRRGYLHFLTLLKEVPESNLRPDGKLAWMAEYQPLEGHPDVYDYHHAEHRILLETWMLKPAEE